MSHWEHLFSLSGWNTFAYSLCERGLVKASKSRQTNLSKVFVAFLDCPSLLMTLFWRLYLRHHICLGVFFCRICALYRFSLSMVWTWAITSSSPHIVWYDSILLVFSNTHHDGYRLYNFSTKHYFVRCKSSRFLSQYLKRTFLIKNQIAWNIVLNYIALFVHLHKVFMVLYVFLRSLAEVWRISHSTWEHCFFKCPWNW